MDVFNILLDEFFAINPWLMLAICFILSPGGVFLVGLVAESRIVPVNDEQSKAFFPGDFALGIIIMQFCWMQRGGIFSQGNWGWIHSSRWVLGTHTAATILLVVQRLIFDAPDYPVRSRYSPTKIYHDVARYYIFTSLIVIRGIPELIAFLSYFGIHKKMTINWIIVFGFAIVYLVCVSQDKLERRVAENLFLDNKTPLWPYVLETRYPSDWEPIWKTKKIRQ